MLEQCQTERTQAGNKPATINRHLAAVKHMFTKAVEWDMVEEEVLKRVRRVKLLARTSRRLRYIAFEECLALITNCDSHLRPIVVTALNTGMRRGEILTLKWDNVDMKHGFILLDVTEAGLRQRSRLMKRSKQRSNPCIKVQKTALGVLTYHMYSMIQKQRNPTRESLVHSLQLAEEQGSEIFISTISDTPSHPTL